jgi:hypothetical protein
MRTSFRTAVFLAAFSLPTAAATISGRVVDAGGAPLRNIRVLAQDIAVRCAREECPPIPSVMSGADGSFTLTAPSSLIAVTADPDPPLNRTFARADATGGNVANLVLRVDAETYAYLPDDPPLASRISVGVPDANGMTVIRGAAGSVPPRSYVLVTTNETGHVSWVEAGSDGAFEVSHFGPPGAWLSIDADPVGLVRLEVLRELAFAGEGSLSATATTMLRVPPPANGPLDFAGVFKVDQGYPFAWASGSLDRNRLAPGDAFKVTGKLTVVSPAFAALANPVADMNMAVELISGVGGRSGTAVAIFSSSLLTPTGFAVERRSESFGVNSFKNHPLTRVSNDRVEGTFEQTFTIPRDFPPGWYQPVIWIPALPKQNEKDFGFDLLVTDRFSMVREKMLRLPLIRVGDPGPPRLMWTLLHETASETYGGRVAREDEHHFATATRVVTNPRTLVVPREHRSGKPLRYRLEPFLPAVANGDRGVPTNGPLVPFRLPSGNLVVTIEKPDGTVETIGPAPFVQTRSRAPVSRNGLTLGHGGGHVTDTLQLSTMDPRFDVTFTQYGLHRITMTGSVEDLWGNVWTGGGTYELHVAEPLLVDSSVIPGQPFEIGDVFLPAVRVIPPVPANVEVRFTLNAVETVISGNADRFGWFSPPRAFTIAQAGEYRVDIVARHRDGEGRLRMGSRSFGSVVAPRDSPIVAHGRRGVEGQAQIGPQWFRRTDPSVPQLPGGHVYSPFHSGDVQWSQNIDAALPMITFQDPFGIVTELLRARDEFGFRFQEHVDAGEIPLRSSTPSNVDVHVDPASVDLWGYSYRSVQRPLVAVREQIGEETQSLYWRFDEKYQGQPGVGRNGDLPNDFKFQYGGAVLRGRALAQPLYAIYGSLFVLIANDDPRGGRVFPPFDASRGGPLFTLKGRDIDLFFHPAAVRPGSILQTGGTASFAGQVAPPLPSKVEIVVTSPGGVARTIRGQANRIGWFYDPRTDFLVSEPGVWRARVTVTHDGATSAGQLSPPYPTGDVLGSRGGEFYFYVVSRDAVPLEIVEPPRYVRPADAPIVFRVVPPPGLRDTQLTYTTTMPGFVLEEGTTTSMRYTYDAQKLAADFPNLDLHDDDGYAGADIVTISLMLAGTDASGSRRHFARQIVLAGEELHVTPQEPQAKRRSVR